MKTYIWQKQTKSWLITTPDQHSFSVPIRVGSDYLTILLQNPQEQFRYLQLVCQKDRDNVEEQFCRYAHYELLQSYPKAHKPLPEVAMADRKTIIEVGKRILYIKEQIRLFRNFNDYGRMELWEEELQKLTAYFKEVWSPLGKPRFFTSPEFNVKMSVVLAIRRYVQIIRKYDVFLAGYLKRHILFKANVVYYEGEGEVDFAIER
jgi:hypothetical protein